MENTPVTISARQLSAGKIEVTVSNSKVNPIAFFYRLSLLNVTTNQRILPVFYSKNYFSVLPGEEVKVILEYKLSASEKPVVEMFGWNVDRQLVEIE